MQVIRQYNKGDWFKLCCDVCGNVIEPGHGAVMYSTENNAEDNKGELVIVHKKECLTIAETKFPHCRFGWLDIDRFLALVGNSYGVNSASLLDAGCSQSVGEEAVVATKS